MSVFSCKRKDIRLFASTPVFIRNTLYKKKAISKGVLINIFNKPDLSPTSVSADTSVDIEVEIIDTIIMTLAGNKNSLIFIL
jgi:hypothetical protein